MGINELLQEKHITKYRLSALSGVPHVETIYKLAKTLGVSMETLVEDVFAVPNTKEVLREKSYEHGLPEYLQQDLDAFKEGMKTGSSLMDCLWGELYGSINIAEINEKAITPEHADYLRQKFLWGGGEKHGAR